LYLNHKHHCGREGDLVRKNLFVIGVALILFTALVVSYGTASAAGATIDASAAPAQEADATAPVTVTVPYLEQWMGSPHADASAEAFRHWDEEDPAEVQSNAPSATAAPAFKIT
jgi:hypothetical protein